MTTFHAFLLAQHQFCNISGSYLEGITNVTMLQLHLQCVQLVKSSHCQMPACPLRVPALLSPAVEKTQAFLPQNDQ